ncbi:CGL94 [Auxenochlorella protothecoides x Auxenochlorella symbiontica]
MEELVDHMDGLTLPETGDDKGKQQVLEDEEDSNPCAICLNTTALEDVAILPGCDHVYCAHCIIHWASLREQGDACCPQCKAPFSEIITYRNLDGTLQDFPVQNSVCLLKRAAWFKERAERHTLPPEDGAAPRRERSWADEDAYDLCNDDDDDLEAFYFSSAAGRARVTLGNRRFGEGGYIASGRRQARPAPSSGKGKHASRQPCHGASPAPAPSAAVAVPARKRLDPGSVSPGAPPSWSGASPTPGQQQPMGSSPSGTGRRARRNARRAALDADVIVVA